ncbi:MAG: hypothetical protein JRJ60_13590 [Deltaproteobacteria bacterium]|nr:hypothetical protein [Deltaproteobacteria bacterium]
MDYEKNSFWRVFTVCFLFCYGCLNSNVLCFGQFVTATEKAVDILDVWLDTKFADHAKWGDYCRDVALPQITAIEKKVFK